MAQVKGQSTENKIVRRLRGGGRGSIVFQQDNKMAAWCNW